MSFKIDERLLKLQGAFGLEILDYKMENIEKTEHTVRHSFKEEIIIPIHAISSNMRFLCNKGKKIIFTSDRIECECIEWKELHLCAMDDEVERLYHCSAWDFVKKWFKYDPNMVSMTFIYMKLKKKE